MRIDEIRKYQGPDGTIASYILLTASDRPWVFMVVEYPDGKSSVDSMSDVEFSDRVTGLMGQHGWKIYTEPPTTDNPPTGPTADPLG